MRKVHSGFTLIELIAVIVIIGIMSVALLTRLSSVSNANLHTGRDDLIAALFFAQQSAMARSNIRVTITESSISVTENGIPLATYKGYPLNLPSGIKISSPTTPIPVTLIYNKLGRTAATTINLTGSGGVSATVKLEASGYAH